MKRNEWERAEPPLVIKLPWKGWHPDPSDTLEVELVKLILSGKASYAKMRKDAQFYRHQAQHYRLVLTGKRAKRRLTRANAWSKWLWAVRMAEARHRALRGYWKQRRKTG